MKKGHETTKSFNIEIATPDDAEGVFNVQRTTWIDTYPNEELGITREAVKVRIEGENKALVPTKIERWRNTIKEGSRDVLVAKSGGKVVGFIAPHFDQENAQYRVGALYVLPETQGTGIGSELMKKALEHIGDDKDVFVHVATYNDNAIQFYEDNGFIKTGRDVTGSVAPLPDGSHIPELEMVRLALKH